MKHDIISSPNNHDTYACMDACNNCNDNKCMPNYPLQFKCVLYREGQKCLFISVHARQHNIVDNFEVSVNMWYYYTLTIATSLLCTIVWLWTTLHMV